MVEWLHSIVITIEISTEFIAFFILIEVVAEFIRLVKLIIVIKFIKAIELIILVFIIKAGRFVANNIITIIEVKSSFAKFIIIIFNLLLIILVEIFELISIILVELINWFKQ